MMDESRSGDSENAPPAPLRRPRLGKVGLAALLLAVGGAAAGILVRHRHETDVKRWTAEAAIPTVSVIMPQPGPSKTELTLPGDIEAWYEAPIYARVNGYLKAWYFDYGARVKKGDLLAEIDAPDLDAQLAASLARLNAARSVVRVRQAEVDFAETTYERWRNSPRGVVSVQEQENKKADYRTAMAKLNAAVADVSADQGDVNRLQALEGFKRIIAPFDGVVTARETDIGALIDAGSGRGRELFRVADVHEMRVFVQVPQRQSAGMTPGLVAGLDLPQYPGRHFKAVVATTAQAIDRASRTLLVELHADNPDGSLQPGAYVEVHFEVPGNPSLVKVPTSALLFRKDGLKVAVVGPDDRVELRSVQLGRNLGSDVDVLSGLSPSDRTVNRPPDSLASGDAVRVANEEVQGNAHAEAGSGAN